MNYSEIILIPALNPDEKLIHLIEQLHQKFFNRIVVVDDGSDKEYAAIFLEIENMDCMVIHQESNQGKGAAIKTGIRAGIESFGKDSSFITVDADGQHLPEDIVNVAGALRENPAALVLGTRDFHRKEIPKKSKYGNQITSVFFKLTTGTFCSDTQTGLRGIPVELVQQALLAEGNRYEYEMNFLVDVVRDFPLVMVPIQTVYIDDNRGSHFRPIRDSILIYKSFFRFLIASITGFAVDYILFLVLLQFLSFSQTYVIVAATVIARIISGIVNFFMNKYLSFQSRQAVVSEMFRYGILFVFQMSTSAVVVTILAFIGIPELLGKLVVDSMLFFASFIIQKRWVFKKEVKLGSQKYT